ncbi:hypothetical protein CSKR_111878 [Clonorchis sinensis]|uniref:Uncharacterized protein n=1 Tax=Clonorchis sinensis TaxID=79923 RepID=A0A8T1MD86_CLOSI|nr:hypothetical protein CSKR_111878 [Clonorchis sinensis]
MMGDLEATRTNQPPLVGQPGSQAKHALQLPRRSLEFLSRLSPMKLLVGICPELEHRLQLGKKNNIDVFDTAFCE